MLTTKAIIFSHFSTTEEMRASNIIPRQLINIIKKEWGGAIGGFAECDNIKRIYLFISDAYIAYLNRNKRRNDYIDIVSEEQAIKGELDLYIQEVYPASADKFVFIGFNELRAFVGQLEGLAENNEQKSLSNLVLGSGSELYYDCPKLIEAVIRIGLRHKDLPILRFDQDVIVNNLGIDKLIEHYEHQRSRYFFFSGSYQYYDPDRDASMHWLNDYAVRTHFLSKTKDGRGYKDLLNEVNLKFEVDNQLASHFISSLNSIGAAPNRQPISGAGLCISPMAIVQFPPFTNVGKNIVWIDDCIKLAMHIGVEDIDSSTVCQLPWAEFQQDRYKGKEFFLNDVEWGYNKYLPRLVYGCLMYSVMLNQEGLPGPYAKNMIEYMITRKKPKMEDRLEWAIVMSERIREMRRQWQDNKYRDNPSGRGLFDYANNCLNIDAPECKDFINEIVENPIVDPALFQDDNAGCYIGEVIADLARYYDLLDIWPYLIRTIDFDLRHSSSALSWLKDR